MLGRDRLLKHALRERFIVTLKNGEAFDGILVEADTKTVRLVDAFALEGKNRLSVDGELYLARAEINYMQKFGGHA